MSQSNSNEIEYSDDSFQLLHSLFDVCSYGVIVIDNSGDIILWNSWVADRSGVQGSVAQGKQLSYIFPQLSQSRLFGLIDNALKKCASGMLSHALNKVPFPLYDPQDAQQKIKHAVYVRPITLANGTRYCAIELNDVTAALRREQQLRKLADQEQEAKIAAENLSHLKSGFISTVSHELRTPLTSIRGSLGLIAGGAVGELPKQSMPLIDIAQKNTERLLLLINDILDMEKIESGKLSFEYKSVDVMAFLEQALEANIGYAEQHGVSIRIAAMEKGAKIYADSDRLMQVMNNLISNAAKFSPEGNTVEISAVRHGGEIRISVTDHGPGIPKAFQAHLFEKFTQADSSSTRTKGGTGLGMNISQFIVEKHSGKLRYITDENIGTTLYFDLPEWADSSNANLDGGTLDQQELDDQKRILVCEDDVDIATVLRLMLEQNGFTVNVAHNAAVAKELLNSRHFNAMTLDIKLPGQNGYSLYKEIRQCSKIRELPIIVVSAEVDEAKQKLAGSAVGIADWLSKPLDQGRLISAIKLASAQNSHENSLPRILHVEDDLSISGFIKELLEDKAKINHATTLSDAKKLIESEKFDVVLLDVGLPDGSGLDLLGFIQAKSPSTSAIVFSGQDVTEESAQQLKDSLFSERTGHEDLAESIRHLIH